MINENQITIGFRMKDTNGGEYTQESTVEVFFDQGEDELQVIGRQLNCFLRQVGYFRHNDYILMEDLTEDEYEAAEEFLGEFRKERNRNEDE